MGSFVKKLDKIFTKSKAVDKKTVWQECLFVFDTNALLNLYRFDPDARDDFFSILERHKSRIWIPHHIGIEFFRNADVVANEINEQEIKYNSAFEQMQTTALQTLNKTRTDDHRYNLLDLDTFKDDLAKLIEKYKELIKKKKSECSEKQVKSNIKDKLLRLFDGSIGLPPESQKTIDRIYAEATKRFANKIPPGYEDLEKAQEPDNTYIVDGIYYQRCFGDYLIWSQTLKHVKKSEIPYFTFITDDAKSDWWEKPKNKKSGPRKLLIEEAQHLGGVQVFQMCSSEQFLKNIKEYLGTSVKPDTLKQAKDLSTGQYMKTENPHYRHLIERYMGENVTPYMDSSLYHHGGLAAAVTKVSDPTWSSDHVMDHLRRIAEWNDKLNEQDKYKR